VLLGVGVVGFPLLFETQPRPMPGRPIEIPREGERPAAGAAARPSGVAAATCRPAGRLPADGASAPDRWTEPASVAGAATLVAARGRNRRPAPATPRTARGQA
jgi:DedD protein